MKLALHSHFLSVVFVAFSTFTSLLSFLYTGASHTALSALPVTIRILCDFSCAVNRNMAHGSCSLSALCRGPFCAVYAKGHDTDSPAMQGAKRLAGGHNPVNPPLDAQMHTNGESGV